jgi:serine/threonine protein kinase
MWRSASKTDEAYNQFLRNPDTIRSTHPLSKGAADIIKRIFVVNPLERITLSELREEMMNLDTLFMSEEDLLQGPPNLREAVINYSAPWCSSSDTLYPRVHSSGDTVFGILDEENPEEQYLFPSPDPDVPYPYLLPVAPRIISPTLEDPPINAVLATLPLKSVSTRSENYSGDSSSSGADSDGPITPETHAVDPAIEVPEFTEGESLDQSVVFADSSYVASKAKLMPKAWSPGRLKTAAQRVKAKMQKV